MSDTFNRYLEQALEQLSDKMTDADRKKRLPDSSSVGLPHLFTLLAAKPFNTSSNADPEISHFLLNVFQKKLKPSDLTSPGGNSSAAEEMLAAAAKANSVNITPAEAKEILRLLQTGDFFGDVSESSAAIVHCVPGLPLAILTDVKGTLSPKLFISVLKDLRGIKDVMTSLNGVQSIIQDLQDGTFDRPPTVMSNTLRELFRKATVKSGLRTVHALYSKDNRSVRLATILYARSNGLNIDETDIDTALDGPLNPDNPNLGPAMTRAYEKLAKGEV